MNEQDFEKYWKENRLSILEKDSQYIEVKNGYKVKSGASWLFYAIPVVTGIIFMDYVPIKQEILKWLASAGVTIFVFIICVWIMSLLTNTASLDDVERQVKQRYHDKEVVD